MAYLFDSFAEWKEYSKKNNMTLVDVVLEYERHQKGRKDSETMDGLARAWEVMKDAVQTGLSENM